MPELPDVEILARGLRRRLRGKRIRAVRLLTPSTVRHPGRATFRRTLAGRRITGVARRGKYLLIALDGDLTLAVHLRMTGDLVVARMGAPLPPHTRVVFTLEDTELRFTDQRRFGHMDLIRGAERERAAGLRSLGVEPLSPAFTLSGFEALIGRRRLGVKALLLRQDLIAGIGNLYADEILWQARLHPARTTDTLTPRQRALLWRTIRHVLDRAIRERSRYGGAVGTLIDARDRGGRCPRGHGPLRVMRAAGRTTYLCPRCQREVRVSPPGPRGSSDRSAGP
jgi:formamidopyrimidine-DNA glycosylase